MAAGITVGGKLVPVLHPQTRHPVPVLDWRDTGLEFKAGDGYNKARAKEADLFVWHWTGAEGEPDRVFRTLRARKLGVEFAISRQGVIYQFCDPAFVDTADAGIVNSRSWGCEVVNYGFRGGRDPRHWLVPKLGKDRETYSTTLNGRKRTFARFYPWQVSSVLALADAVTAATGKIRRAVPANPDTMGAAELASFSGFISHSNITAAKSDCGPELLDALRTHFG